MPLMSTYGGASARAWRPRGKLTPKWRWDTAFNTGVAYSNGDATAVTPDASPRTVAANTSKSSGKHYAEIRPTVSAGSNYPALVDTGAVANGLNWNGSTGWGYSTGGTVFHNNVPAANWSPWAAGDIIGVAFDATAKLLWFSVNGVWNGDPAAGTGGISLTGTAWRVAHVFWSPAGDTVVIPDFLTYSAPSGFQVL